MNHAGNGNGKIEYRRQYIATLLIRRPKITQRQTHEHLAKMAVDPVRGTPFINDDTGQPFSLGTINNDIQQIRAGWQPARGFQLRYIYFLDPSWRSRLTVPEIPYSKVWEMGAAMLRGEKLQHAGEATG